MSDDIFARYRIDRPLTAQESRFLVYLRTSKDDLQYLEALHGAGLLVASDRAPARLNVACLTPAMVERLLGQTLLPLSARIYERGTYDVAYGCAALATRLGLGILGSEHARTLASVSNLATFLRSMGLASEALPYYEWVLAIRERTLPAEHPETLVSVNYLAMCLQYLDRVREALPHYERVLECRMQALGSRHPHTLQSMNNLGSCLVSLNRKPEALSLFERALAASEQVRPPGDPETVILINNLAATLDGLGRPAEARPWFLRALQATELAVGPEHPDTLTAASNLATCLESEGHAAEALPYCERALQGRRRRLQPDHPDTLTSVNNLGTCLMALGRANEALSHCQYAMDARQRVLGAAHANTLSSILNLAACLLSLGHLTEALSYAEQYMEGIKRTAGLEHPDVASDGINILALCLKSLSRADEALPLYRLAWETRSNQLGHDHPRTLNSRSNLAACLLFLGRPAEALVHYEQVLKIRNVALGTQHHETLHSVGDVAACLSTLGRESEALPHYRQALEGFERALGSEHPDTLLSMNNFAMCLAHLHREREALPHCQRVLEICKRTLGTEHPHTLRSISNLSGFLEALGDKDSAIELWLQLLTALQARPQPGGFWMDTAVTAATALASHAAAGRVPDWDGTMARLSSALLQVIDLQSPEQTTVARAPAAKIFSVYLNLCIDAKRPDLIPAMLAARQGRKVAAFALEDLEARSGALDTQSLHARFQSIRLELRRLSLGLQSYDAHAASSRATATDRALPSAEAYIARQHEQMAVYKAKLREYQLLRAELGRADPEFSIAARALTISTPQLQARLEPRAALLLLFERDGDGIAIAHVHLALLIAHDSVALVPLTTEALARAIVLSTAWSSMLQARSGMRHGGALKSDSQVAEVAETSQPGRLEVLHDLVQSGLWSPLCAYLENIDELHVVTHGASHALPIALGAPASITLHFYPGLVYYHRVRHQADDKSVTSGPTTSTGGALGISVHAAEDSPGLTAIPFVRVEQAIVRALWPGSVHSDADLSVATPHLSVLQLAGHGQADPRDPARANLLLKKGALDLQAVLRSPQRPSVVVLSACTVGRTSEDPDGEPLGLVGAFLLKGARCVIACLQPVPDFYMPLFMALLHESWRTGNSPAAALADAKHRFATGEWHANTAALIRAHYRTVVIERLREVSRPEPAAPIDPLLVLTHVWPFPSPYGALAVDDNAQLGALRAQLCAFEGCERTADAILDYFVTERDRIPARHVDTLCTWVIAYGA